MTNKKILKSHWPFFPGMENLEFAPANSFVADYFHDALQEYRENRVNLSWFHRPDALSKLNVTIFRQHTQSIPPTGLGIYLSKHAVAGVQYTAIREIVPGFAACKSAQLMVGDILEWVLFAKSSKFLQYQQLTDRSCDEIRQVDGQSVSGMNPAAIQQLTLGPVGSQCTLMVRREKRTGIGAFTFHEVRLTRVVPETLNSSSSQIVATFRYLPEEKKNSLRRML